MPVRDSLCTAAPSSSAGAMPASVIARCTPVNGPISINAWNCFTTTRPLPGRLIRRIAAMQQPVESRIATNSAIVAAKREQGANMHLRKAAWNHGFAGLAPIEVPKGGTCSMRLLAAALLTLAITAAPAAAQDAASARAFLQSIYRHYVKDAPGAPLDKPYRFFEPELAAAIKKDQDEAEARGDMSKMDADPFCECQDFEAIKAAIGPIAVNGKRATATVRFTNGGPVTIRYTLAWTRSGWRVFEIEWQEMGTLRAMYFGVPDEPEED
jgi:hypothetical protein